jgi:hypothetical protein
MGDISLILEYPGMTEQQVTDVVLSAPGVTQDDNGNVYLDGEYLVDIWSTEPDDCLVDLIDWEKDDANKAIDRLYYYLEANTSWRLWTNYEDLAELYAEEGVFMKERPAQFAA